MDNICKMSTEKQAEFADVVCHRNYTNKAFLKEQLVGLSKNPNNPEYEKWNSCAIGGVRYESKFH
jgi:hypothetical protein